MAISMFKDMLLSTFVVFNYRLEECQQKLSDVLSVFRGSRIIKQEWIISTKFINLHG